MEERPNTLAIQSQVIATYVPPSLAWGGPAAMAVQCPGPGSVPR